MARKHNRDKRLERYISEANKFPTLSLKEELALARKSFRGDLEARRRLVESSLVDVIKIAYGYFGYCRRQSITLGDIIQEGNLALMKASGKFDPKQGYRFMTYAQWAVRSRIHHFLQLNFDIVSMGVGPLFFALGDINQITNTQDEEKKDELREALRKKKGRSTEEIKRYEKRLDSIAFSLDTKIKGDNCDDWYAIIPDQSPDVEGSISKKKFLERVREQIAETDITPREMEIVRRRYLSSNPDTMREIGESFGVSRQRIEQIEKLALTKLFYGFKAAGIDQEYLNEQVC